MASSNSPRDTVAVDHTPRSAAPESTPAAKTIHDRQSLSSNRLVGGWLLDVAFAKKVLSDRGLVAKQGPICKPNHKKPSEKVSSNGGGTFQHCNPQRLG